mgnify:CR=1 FL=1
MTLISLPINPVPAGAVTGTFEGFDGLRLRYARWEPTRGPVRGTICIFPGRGEFIEKYFEVVADLRRRGFAVAMHDWRGQGGSERMLSNSRKGHVLGFTQYDRDVPIFRSLFPTFRRPTRRSRTPWAPTSSFAMRTTSCRPSSA